jgi:hypothetical protein
VRFSLSRPTVFATLACNRPELVSALAPDLQRQRLQAGVAS